MTDQITVTIPQSLYNRARKLAALRNQAVVEVLAEALALIEAANKETLNEERLMAREEAAYQAMYQNLSAKYIGNYVAIYQGKLIDHDADELALLHRLDNEYPHDVVLMKKVLPQPEPELRFRSPRFVAD